MATLSTQRPLYPIGVPAKFSPDGVVQRFAGNTTLCHLPLDSPLLPPLHAVCAALSSKTTLAKRIHWLPPASWHMTILGGVREHIRGSGSCAPGKETQPQQECTDEIAQRLRELDLESQGLGPPYRLKVRGFDAAVVGIGIEVEGATVDEEKRLRRLRDVFADKVLGFRAADHDTFIFHLSLAYLLRHIDGDERKTLNIVFAEHLPHLQQHEFDLGAVEFCTFENMHSFQRLFYLGAEN